MPKLKVWDTHMCFVNGAHPARGQNSGQVVGAVAATSQRIAAAALGVSMHEFRRYVSETEWEPAVEAALKHPGHVVVSHLDHRGTEPRRWYLLDGTEVV